MDVTLQKRDQASEEESSNDGNSTGDTSNGTSTGNESTSTGNSTGDENASTGNSTGSALVTMTTPFDTKFEHVLNNYLSATGADHHIRKAFIHKQIFSFEEFTDGSTVENIKTFQQDDGTNNLVQAFSSVKLTMITNVLLYYDFLIDDSQ